MIIARDERRVKGQREKVRRRRGVESGLYAVKRERVQEGMLGGTGDDY
jgi:hypothetical protein